MAYDISDYSISDAEIGAEEDELAGEVGAAKARRIRRLTHKVAKKHAREEANAAIQALKNELRGGPLAGPQVEERGPGRLFEVPFPLGSVTAPKSGVSATLKNNAQSTFRCERLIVDDSGLTPSATSITVDDIRLANRSQYLSGGQMLASFFGPTAFNTPFKGMTIGAGVEAAVDVTNLDTTADHLVFAGFYGNALLG